MNTNVTPASTLTRRQQTKILQAFISRLTDKQIRNILAKSEACTIAQLNWGLTAQIKCQEIRNQAVAEAVDSLIDHDIDLIAQVIQNVTADNA